MDNQARVNEWIEFAGKHFGVEVAPWQREILEVALSEGGCTFVSYRPRSGLTLLKKLYDKASELKASEENQG